MRLSDVDQKFPVTYGKNETFKCSSTWTVQWFEILQHRSANILFLYFFISLSSSEKKVREDHLGWSQSNGALLKGASITPTCYRLCIISFFRRYDLKHNRCVGGGLIASLSAKCLSWVSCPVCVYNPLLFPFSLWILFRILSVWNLNFVSCFVFLRHIFFFRRVFKLRFCRCLIWTEPTCICGNHRGKLRTYGEIHSKSFHDAFFLTPFPSS